MIEYECQRCQEQVTGSPLRHTCPHCGGSLVSRHQSD
ncbi:DUF1272 domain-containing protein [Halomicroarcula sp. GCM10025709]